MAEKYQNKYRITSARAMWNDYDDGLYFVTICTNRRRHYFGKIVMFQTLPQTMQLSEIGRYLDEQIRSVTTHYAYAQIPFWVIMPDHIHLIVAIDGKKIPHKKRNILDVNDTPEINGMMDMHGETFHETSLQTPIPHQKTSLCNYAQQNNVTSISSLYKTTQMQSWLSVVIRQLKSAVTHYAKQNHISFEWQPRFHDHIIRDQRSLWAHIRYIEKNVENWCSKGSISF